MPSWLSRCASHSLHVDSDKFAKTPQHPPKHRDIPLFMGIPDGWVDPPNTHPQTHPYSTHTPPMMPTLPITLLSAILLPMQHKNRWLRMIQHRNGWVFGGFFGGVFGWVLTLTPTHQYPPVHRRFKRFGWVLGCFFAKFYFLHSSFYIPNFLSQRLIPDIR